MKKPKTSMNGFPDLSLIVADNSAPNLAGKRVLIVGGTDGIGQALAQGALKQGAQVTVVGRTFRDAAQPQLSFVQADLSSMKVATQVGGELSADHDVVVFTTGIMAAPQRQETAEGIERDLAISTLSRYAILKALAPRLKAGTRVFITGFPGAGQLGDPSDLNASGKYDPMKTHMTTVAGNEANVLWARAAFPTLDIFGLNPGIIRTKIRSNFLGEGLKFKLIETIIGLLTPTADAYATKILPLFTAPELKGRSGAMFGKKGKAILATEGFDRERVEKFVHGYDLLLAKV